MQINAEWAGETVAWLDRHRIATGPLLENLRIDRRDLKYGRQTPAAHFAAVLDFGAAQTRDAYFGLRRNIERGRVILSALRVGRVQRLRDRGKG
jgi:hypothetical protein